MLKSIISYFWGESGTDLTFDEAYKVLQDAQEELEEPAEEVAHDSNPKEFACYHKSGVVTAAQNGYCVIDNAYEFKSDLKNLAVGSQVFFTIYTSKGKIKVSDVTIRDDWSCEPTGETSWCARSFICKVSARDGRKMHVMPGDITIDLNSVSSEFVPIVGDWVELEAKVELDENVSDLFGKVLEVEKVRPLRPRILEGHVKRWSDETKRGVIDGVIFFSADALVCGYVPVVGDKVVTEVIESEQGQYACRSIKIVPEKQRDLKLSLSDALPVEFECDKEGVFVSENVFICARKLTEIHSFAMEVSNKSGDKLVLSSVTLPSINSQAKIVKPATLTNIEISPGTTVHFEGVCTVKNMGTIKELVLFSFENFRIGRWITVSLEAHFNNQIDNAKSANRGSLLLPRTHFKQNSRELIRGQRTVVAPRFISARLPDYPVPQKLSSVVFKHEDNAGIMELMEELRHVKPCLSLPLTFNIYEDRFHTLLHLEEIQDTITMRSYAQDRACFIKNGEYMMLEIENLSERRPSLIIGDRIIAKDPYNADADELEGVIHKVGAKHVYIKFAQMFHDTYNSDDMSVMAVASRTQFRRMHQAVGLAIRNLGLSFLFPTKVIGKKPQANFEFEKYYDSINAAHNAEITKSQGDNGDSLNSVNKFFASQKNRLNQKKSVEALTENSAPKTTNRNKQLLETLKLHTLRGRNTQNNSSFDSTNKAEVAVSPEAKTSQRRCDEIYTKLEASRMNPSQKQPKYSAVNTTDQNQSKASPAESDHIKTENGQNITSPVKSQLLLQSNSDYDPIIIKNFEGETIHRIPKKNANSTFKPPTTNPAKHPLKLEWYNKSLNYYQKEAVRNILLGEARPLPYFIFGPPGTGKTVTLVETILQLLRLIPHSRLLVATPSNSAADLIALRLIDSGVLKPGDLIRLVAYRCVAENTLPVKLVPYCATADITREGTGSHTFSVTDTGLTLGCSSAVIGRHRVTVGTCCALGILFTMGFSKGHFTHIIVDEAGQATEPEVMIPIALLDVLSGQVILAGDPMQLGPVIASTPAVSFGLEETYLDRMLSKFPYERDPCGFPDTAGYDPRLVTRLVYNYRSLPDVLTLSSTMFYNGQLVSTISPVESKEAHLLCQLQEILPRRKNSGPPAVVFHGVMGENYQTNDCPSWFNPNEASQIFYYVNELYRLGLKSTDIGIISPYVKQVKQIRALLVEAEFEIPKVGTVEEFQGQEFNVILLSTVRSSESLVQYDLKYKLGFLSSPRRLNVAITRAQALMIIVGNPHLLCSDPHWRNVIRYCVESEAYCGCALPSC